MEKEFCSDCGGSKEVPRFWFDQDARAHFDCYVSCPKCKGVGFFPNTKTVSIFEDRKPIDKEKILTGIFEELDKKWKPK